MFSFQRSNNKKPFHTSGYAEAAYGESMGATSSQSYRERSAIDNNRQNVGKYHESSIAHNLKGRTLGANQGRHPRVAGDRTMPAAGRSRQFGGQSPLQPPAPRERFSEPPGRGYNPFG